MPTTIQKTINKKSAKERRSASIIKPCMYFILEMALILELSYVLSKLDIYLWLIFAIAITYIVLKTMKLFEILDRARTIGAEDKYKIL